MSKSEEARFESLSRPHFPTNLKTPPPQRANRLQKRRRNSEAFTSSKFLLDWSIRFSKPTDNRLYRSLLGFRLRHDATRTSTRLLFVIRLTSAAVRTPLSFRRRLRIRRRTACLTTCSTILSRTRRVSRRTASIRSSRFSRLRTTRGALPRSRFPPASHPLRLLAGSHLPFHLAIGQPEPRPSHASGSWAHFGLSPSCNALSQSCGSALQGAYDFRIFICSFLIWCIDFILY